MTAANEVVMSYKSHRSYRGPTITDQGLSKDFEGFGDISQNHKDSARDLSIKMPRN